jgi:hypothetical protein
MNGTMMMKTLAPCLACMLVLAVAQPGGTQTVYSLFEATKPAIPLDLAVRASGPDYLICWNPVAKTSDKPFVYLVFSRPHGKPAWSYLGYADIDTCFVHYGASLFYPEIDYEVHTYSGSLRKLPYFPRDPQDPRFPGEAIRSLWESPFSNP